MIAPSTAIIRCTPDVCMMNVDEYFVNEIYERYNGDVKGDLSKTVFELPDLTARFQAGKIAFIANQMQYRVTTLVDLSDLDPCQNSQVTTRSPPHVCALQRGSMEQGSKQRSRVSI